MQARVSGRVQGVSFRWCTQEQARGLGVVGWVRNEPDGSVAGHFEGPTADVEALVAWCHQGPPQARVARVVVRPAAPAGHRSFDIRH